ncbi:hypothetical protein [Metallosphaera tengchongensis]|uniref:hypothetical protein n=1 Tax=Metallosphaera tengchongensis TaxID=1532350 RepID=UPI001C2ECC4E|nr:hypothetical protein [Metallosphaera tengchongensis]
MIKASHIGSKSELIYYDGNCVSQALINLPPESVIRQACYIFFQNFQKRRIKNPTLYFLSLLNSTNQIKKAMENSIPDGYTGEFYIIQCCKDEDISDVISIETYEERLALSKNSIFSIE